MSRRRADATKQETPVKKIQKEGAQERKQLRVERRKKFFKRFFAILFLIGLGVGLYYFDQSSYSKVRTIQIIGNEYVDDTLIVEFYQIETGDRLLTSYIKSRFKKQEIDGIAKVDIKLYYTKGLITLTVKESPLVAYSHDTENKVLFADNSFISTNHTDIKEVPRLVGMDAAFIAANPKFADKLSRMSRSVFNGISEIHRIDDPLETVYFKLFMNNGFYVHTNLKNLLLMDYYPEIISKLDNEENRCIYFLDDGRTEDNQSAVAKKCE